uniref:FYVE-type domain-containing protein n=1 Tax=Globisporangium ultimum (strain ATCC 200006 / CBS 805.95 / DAOM BR144) TaxID=431595 RepID=K3X1X4_GLOUD
MKTSHLHLSRDREQTVKMHHRAIHQINQVLDVCLNSSRTKDQWTCLRKEKHLAMYAKKHAMPMASLYLLGVNEAKCGFDEVYDLMSFDSTEKFRLMMALIYGKDCKDAGLISMRPRNDRLSEWSLNTQHAAIWFALQNRRKAALVREKSFTFFQTLKVILPEQRPSGMTIAGRPSEGVQKRTMALSWLPFPEADEFDFDDANDAVNLQYTLIIEELERDRLRISSVTSSFHDGDAPSASSRWAARAIARRLVFRSISRLEAAVITSRISDQEVLAQNQWVKNEERVACVICWKQFNALYRRRHHCRICGDVICGSCSSMRRTSAVSKKDVDKVRICHLCSNKGRVKADSFASTTDTFPGHHTTDEELPIVKFPRAGFYPTPSLRAMVSYVDEDGKEDESDYDDYMDDMDDGYEGYIGRGPDSLLSDIYSSQKVISIKSITQSDLKVRSLVNFSVGTKQSLAKRSNSGGEIQTRKNDQARYSVSFLHPAALVPPDEHALQPIVANYGSYEEYALTGSDSENSSNRRTSVSSSIFRLSDRYYVDEGYFLPKLDPAREQERLRLMKVVCSPACTLIDPPLMKKCCEIAASAFGVTGAFIARVDELHVGIEQSVGVQKLYTHDQYLRHETLCDFVLVQPEHHPLVILDCMIDPRTRDIPMKVATIN